MDRQNTHEGLKGDGLPFGDFAIAMVIVSAGHFPECRYDEEEKRRGGRSEDDGHVFECVSNRGFGTRTSLNGTTPPFQPESSQICTAAWDIGRVDRWDEGETDSNQLTDV